MFSLNHIFGRVRQILKLPQNLSPYIRYSFKFVLEVCQKPKSTLVRYGILAECFLMPNPFEKCENIFQGKQGKLKNLPPTPPPTKNNGFIRVFYKCIKICQKHKLNRLSYSILVSGFLMTNLVDELKTIFLKKQGKPCNCSKSFHLY